MQNNEKNIMDFLDDYTSKSNNNATPKPKVPKENVKIENNFIPNLKNNIDYNIPDTKTVNNHNHDSNKFEDVVMSDLPLYDFYKPGVKIKFRECTVKEIQQYSTLDESSIFDFKDKLNDIISNCVLYYNDDGTLGTYEQIYEGDRVWLIYLIREKTFPKGKNLSVPIKYKDDNGEEKSVKIDLIRENFEKWKNQEIMEFFDLNKRCFLFNTILNDKTIYMKPPTIGMKRCFDHYLKIKKENKQDINTTFFKIAPFLNPDMTYMNWEDFQKYEKWFTEELSPQEYSFLFDIINNHLKIGIRGIKKNMGSSVLRSNKMYPNRLSTIFLLPNAFRLYIRQ